MPCCQILHLLCLLVCRNGLTRCKASGPCLGLAQRHSDVGNCRVFAGKSSSPCLGPGNLWQFLLFFHNPKIFHEISFTTGSGHRAHEFAARYVEVLKQLDLQRPCNSLQRSISSSAAQERAKVRQGKAGALYSIVLQQLCSLLGLLHLHLLDPGQPFHWLLGALCIRSW